VGTAPVQLIVWGNATDLEPPPISSGRKGCCSCVQLYCFLPARGLLPCELVVIATQKKQCNLAEASLESIPTGGLMCRRAFILNFVYQSIDSHRDYSRRSAKFGFLYVLSH